MTQPDTPPPDPNAAVHYGVAGRTAGFSMPIRTSAANAEEARQFLLQQLPADITGVVCDVEGSFGIVITCGRDIDDALRIDILQHVLRAAQKYAGIRNPEFMPEP